MIHDFTTIIPRAIVFLILVYGENVTNQYDPDKIWWEQSFCFEVIPVDFLVFGFFPWTERKSF